MQKEQMTILIVDDDQTLGKALREAFIRSGFRAIHVTKPDDAIANAKLHSVSAAVIDCMLPKMNGRDLSVKLKQEVSSTLPIFLMSGIYKDKNFAREAMHQTGAVEFMTKPFQLEEMVNEVTEALKPVIDVPLAPLNSVFCRDTLSPIERIAAINRQESVHGYELPWVFSVLAYPKVNGNLLILTAEGEELCVSFKDGKIVQVNQKDALSYFGVLMVEYGFITQEELDEIMKVPNKNKRMGERLVDANVLSPHAIDLVMVEQQGIRLGKTVKDSAMKIVFTETTDVREEAQLDRDDLTDLLNDWLLSKVSTDWLKSTYRQWHRFSIKEGPEFSLKHRLFTRSVLMRTPNLHQQLLSSATLADALEAAREPADHVYASLHLLFVTRILRFGDSVSTMDFDAQKNRLIRLTEELQRQNFFERLGVSSKSREADIKRSYHDLAKVLHPDKLPASTPADIKDLARAAFAKIGEAYETLANAQSREEYLVEMERGRADAILEAEHLKEQAQPLLTKGDFRKARELLEMAIAVAPPTAEIRMMQMWARMKSHGTESIQAVTTQIRDQLASIPPEDRHNPIYYLVKGMNMRLAGDDVGAKKSLEQAVSIDPDFIDAKRELSLLQAQKSQSQNPDLLRGDLKDVVGKLFKKMGR